MRRPDRKRARPSVQPRLTAFLQPALKAVVTSEQPSTDLVVVEDGIIAGQTKSNGGGDQCKLWGVQRGAEMASRGLRAAEGRHFEAPLQSESEGPAVAQQMATSFQACDASPREDLQAGSDDPLDICKQPRQWASSKGSLEAFIKRHKIAPQRETSVEQDGKRARAALGRAALGRAVNGSAYAQCPLCTVQIPLTRMNHHLDIECAQRATHPAIAPRAAIAPYPATARTLDQQKADRNGPAPDVADISTGVRKATEDVSDAGECADVDCGGANLEETVDKSSGLSGMGGVRKGQGAGLGGPKRDCAGVYGMGGETEGATECEVGASFGDFEVMPTLNEWLPSAHTDGGGPVHTNEGACSHLAAALGASGCQCDEPRRDGVRKQGAPGHVHICQGTEVGVREPDTLGEVETGTRSGTFSVVSMASERSRCQGEVAREPVRINSREPVHTSSNEPVHTPGQERSRTPSPARREPVHTSLGMVRERGQRPLFGLSWAAIQARQPSAPKGHYLVENFLTEEEEAHILTSLDADVSNPWVTSRAFGDLNEGKAYGFVTDLRRRTTSKPKRPMPPFLQSVLDRIRTVAPPLSNFVPNECNAINYRREDGHWLRPHVDDRQLSGTVIAGISLLSDCVMTYERERGRPEKFRVRLPRRCLQVKTQDSRYNFTHSIKNADLAGERRVSITFRQVAEPRS